MGDSVRVPSSSVHQEISRRKLTQSRWATSAPKISNQLNCQWLVGGNSGQIIPFLLKVAALELVRRVSRKKCPLVWQAVQAIQLVAYPPFKWIGRWKPLRNLITGVQSFSRPLLFLSIATTFSDLSGSLKEISDSVNDCQESAITHVTSETRVSNEASESEDWLLQVHKELDRQGVLIPERIDDNELQRFYTAADGDFSCLLRSVKRTIRWRETYGIMTLKEMESWSHLVFWHGSDLELQPCLVLRLGLACSSLVPRDRPRFTQAVVSQVEHGVLHLLIGEDTRITVLIDCEGLSAANISLQMIKVCSTIMQEHYPNRLASLYVLRLSHAFRTVAQTLIQDLKPRTKQKIQIASEANIKDLSETLKSVPSFLGGDCTCSICQGPSPANKARTETSENISNVIISDKGLITASLGNLDIPYISSRDHVLRTAVIGMLVFWVLVALLTGMDNRRFSFN